MRRMIALAFALALIPLLAYPCDRCGRSQCGPCCQQQTCTRPACDPCDTGCDAGCAMPCACMEWEPYCGCEMLTGLCISLTTDPCDGTAGPMHLLLRNGDYDEIVTIELAGPIEATAIMDTNTYRRMVSRTLMTIARGMLRRTSLTSSAIVAMSSKPMKA